MGTQKRHGSRIRGSLSGYEGVCLLGTLRRVVYCKSACVLEQHVASIFRVEKISMNQITCSVSACYMLRAGFLLGLFFDPEDIGDTSPTL
jgi:hypothetical protein